MSIDIRLANIIRDGLSRIGATIPDIVEWTQNNFYISQEESFRPGFWSPDFLPFQSEILREFQNPETTDIVVMSCAQWGKTTLQKAIIAFIAVNQPGPIQVTLPNDDDIKRFDSTRLTPMLRDVPALKNIFVTTSMRDKNNRANMKMFKGGFIFVASANNGNDLSGQPIRYSLGDEVSRWPRQLPRQGSPVELVKARTKTFPNSKRLWFSTPTTKGDLIDSLFELSDKRFLHINCPDCSHSQRITLSEHMKFDPGGGNACFECEQCGHKVYDSSWHQFVRSAKFIPTQKSNGVAGFHVSSVFVQENFSQIVRQFLDTKDDPSKLQGFINLTLGETFEDKGEAVEHLDVFARRDTFLRGEVPEGVEFLTIGADTQNDRIEYEVRGWNRSGESWSIDYVTLNGDTSDVEVWEQFRLSCDREYSGLRPMAICIDSGGQRTSNVYAFVISSDPRRFFAIKGATGDYYVSTPKKQDVLLQGKKIQRAIDLYYVGTDKIKMEIVTSLRIKDGDPIPKNYIHFAHDYDEEHFRRFCSERFDWGLDYNKKNRMVVRKKPQWIKVYQRNEQFDCAVYNRAAFEILGAHKLSEKEFVKFKTIVKKNQEFSESKIKKVETMHKAKQKQDFTKSFGGNKFKLREHDRDRRIV